MSDLPSKYIAVRLSLADEGRYSVGSMFEFGQQMTEEDVTIYTELMEGLLYMVSFEPMELRRKAQMIKNGRDMVDRMNAQSDAIREEELSRLPLPDNVIPFPAPKRVQ